MPSGRVFYQPPQQQQQSAPDETSLACLSVPVSPTSPQLCPTTPTIHPPPSVLPLSASTLGGYLALSPESLSSFDDMSSDTTDIVDDLDEDLIAIESPSTQPSSTHPTVIPHSPCFASKEMPGR